MTVLRYDLLGRLLTFFLFPSLRGLLSVFSPRGNTSVGETTIFRDKGEEGWLAWTSAVLADCFTIIP